MSQWTPEEEAFIRSAGLDPEVVSPSQVAQALKAAGLLPEDDAPKATGAGSVPASTGSSPPSPAPTDAGPALPETTPDDAASPSEAAPLGPQPAPATASSDQAPALGDKGIVSFRTTCPNCGHVFDARIAF